MIRRSRLSTKLEAAANVFGRVDSVRLEDQQSLVETMWSMLAGVVFYFGNTDDFDVMTVRAKELLLRAVFGH